MTSAWVLTSSMGPEVESEFHRLSVTRPEQRLDVLLEAQRPSGLGYDDLAGGVVGFVSG